MDKGVTNGPKLGLASSREHRTGFWGDPGPQGGWGRLDFTRDLGLLWQPEPPTLVVPVEDAVVGAGIGVGVPEIGPAAAQRGEVDVVELHLLPQLSS